MLHNFPEDYELIGFFEAEPVVLDPEVPWIYNTLEFSTNRDGIEVRARISPSYGEVSVSLLLGGRELAIFEWQDVEGVHIDVDKSCEALVIKFAEPRRLDDFVLQLKPTIRVSWGDRRT